jgi:hypothetical protein
VVDAESENGDEELRAERNMPLLTGPGGEPIMMPNSSRAVTRLPPDNTIRRSVRFEMRSSMSNDQAVAAGAEPEPGNGTDMDTALTELTIRRGAASVLETTFGDQTKSGVLLLILFSTGGSSNICSMGDNISKIQRHQWSSKASGLDTVSSDNT